MHNAHSTHENHKNHGIKLSPCSNETDYVMLHIVFFFLKRPLLLYVHLQLQYGESNRYCTNLLFLLLLRLVLLLLLLPIFFYYFFFLMQLVAT